MGYQNGIRTITLTRDGQPVEWIVDYVNKTFTVVVNGQALGTFRTRMAAMAELELVNVPAKGKRAA